MQIAKQFGKGAVELGRADATKVGGEYIVAAMGFGLFAIGKGAVLVGHH